MSVILMIEGIIIGVVVGAGFVWYKNNSDRVKYFVEWGHWPSKSEWEEA